MLLQSLHKPFEDSKLVKSYFYKAQEYLLIPASSLPDSPAAALNSFCLGLQLVETVMHHFLKGKFSLKMTSEWGGGVTGGGLCCIPFLHGLKVSREPITITATIQLIKMIQKNQSQ